MPYPIAVTDGPGLATHLLGNGQEWKLHAVSFSYEQGTSVAVPGIFLDCRAPSGAIIYAQLIDLTDQSTFYSLAEGSEPTAAPIAGTGEFGWPQNGGATGGYVTERLSPITLTAGCTVNVYASTAPGTFPPPDPITLVDNRTVISGVLLWVEDTANSQANQSPPAQTVGPYMLIPGNQLADVAA